VAAAAAGLPSAADLVQAIHLAQLRAALGAPAAVHVVIGQLAASLARAGLLARASRDTDRVAGLRAPGAALLQRGLLLPLIAARLLAVGAPWPARKQRAKGQ